jgi:S-adenosylmethionine/arginine decarboxylase-like enzyme
VLSWDFWGGDMIQLMAPQKEPTGPSRMASRRARATRHYTKTRKNAKKRAFIQHHHLLMRMEIIRCPKKHDVPKVKQLVCSIVKALNMKLLAPPRVYYLDKPENNSGMTCIAPIQTSHIAFHFWNTPDKGVLQNPTSRCLLEFDVYTCGSMTPKQIAAILRLLDQFDPTHAELDIFNRRNGLKLDHHFQWDNRKNMSWDEWLSSKQFK